MSQLGAADRRLVLVTGAQGFVGRAVTAAFRAAGVDCVELEGQLADLPGLTLPVDAVVHLAAVSRPADFKGDLEAWGSNVTGAQDVIDFCLRNGAGLVFASSSGVYRHPVPPFPLTEDAPLAPASDYAVSKWLGETLILRQAASRGLAAVILRVFNPYGPGQDKAFAVPAVVSKLLAGEPLFLRSPDAVRDFIHVDDVAAAFLAACKVLRPGASPVVNVGTGRGLSILQLARLAQGVLGPAVSLQTDPSQAGLGGCVVADVSRAQALLGWRAAVGIEEGLGRMRPAAPRAPQHQGLS